MPGENLTEKVGILPSAADRKNSFLVRFNRIPYNKDTDPYNLNIELAETAVIYPSLYRIFDKWPSWNWEEMSEVTGVLIENGFTFWEIKDILDAYVFYRWKNATES